MRPRIAGRALAKGDWQGVASRVDGKQGNADAKHKVVRLEVGRERAEDKDWED